MNTIPIIFAIDNNVVMQCGVTITSLLHNAKESTHYAIYILCNDELLGTRNRQLLLSSFSDNKQCTITFVNVGRLYDNSSIKVNDHITHATYYRLAIPTLFLQFDKVLYADIDMIFQQDLAELYENSIENNELVAAVLDLAIDDKYYFDSQLPSSIGKTVYDYFNAGFLVMNLKAMREENIPELFNSHLHIKYDQNDQDILNIVCKDRVQLLPSKYNFQLNHYSNYMWHRTQSDIDFAPLFREGTLHYTFRNKPWNSLDAVAYDTWWYYYKLSPFFDNNEYFQRQYQQIEAWRNDFRNKTIKQLLMRICVKIKKYFND